MSGIPQSRPGLRGSVRGLAGSCHPIPTAGVTLVSVLLAAGVGLRWEQVVLLGVAVLTGQLSIGWSNDAIDAARDARAGRADKPVAQGAVQQRVVALAAGAALVLTIVLSLVLGLAAGAALLTLVAAGWAYNLGLKRTLLSGIAYLVGFGALPIAPYLASAGHWPAWWMPATGALLGLAAHFANVLPDLHDDEEAGIRGLPHRLGARRGVIVLATTLAAAAVVLGFGPRSASLAFGLLASVAGVVAAAVAAVVALRAPDSPAAFRITVAIALLDVGLVIAIAT